MGDSFGCPCSIGQPLDCFIPYLVNFTGALLEVLSEYLDICHYDFSSRGTHYMGGGEGNRAGGWKAEDTLQSQLFKEYSLSRRIIHKKTTEVPLVRVYL